LYPFHLLNLTGTILSSYIDFCPHGKCGNVREDPHYFRQLNRSGVGQNELRSIVVYSASINLPDFFLSAFYRLPLNASITLVSGLEDCGVPMELMGVGRRAFDGSVFPREHHFYQNMTRLR
jgi:hypothetical protein